MPILWIETNKRNIDAWHFIYLVQKERLQLLRTQHIKITQGSDFSMPKKYVIDHMNMQVAWEMYLIIWDHIKLSENQYEKQKSY